MKPKTFDPMPIEGFLNGDSPPWFGGLSSPGSPPPGFPPPPRPVSDLHELMEPPGVSGPDGPRAVDVEIANLLWGTGE